MLVKQKEKGVEGRRPGGLLRVEGAGEDVCAHGNSQFHSGRKMTPEREESSHALRGQRGRMLWGDVLP